MSEQKTALVTGASRGIGRGILLALASAGYRVIGTATREAGAQQITDLLAEQGFSGCGRVLNIQDTDSVGALFDALKADDMLPDVLVNNAGIVDDNIAVRLKSEAWDKVIDTNLSGVFRVSQACLRHMMKQRFGRIITIGSIVGSIGNAGSSNYCAAKAGVMGFSKALAQEVATRGITVNVVAPGFIETDMTAVLPEAHQEKLLSMIPMGRMGQSEDIAKAVLYLIQAGYVTGQTIHVNGGMAMI